VKRLLLLACLIVRATAADAEFARHLEQFHQHYNVFLRAYLGCPASAREIEECNPKLGSFDYGEFAKARKHAKTLFQ
jgi:hypothetical protein